MQNENRSKKKHSEARASKIIRFDIKGLDKSYFNNGHITPLGFLALDSDTLDNDEKSLLITHINSCDDCMGEFLLNIEAEEPLSLSDEFYENLNGAIAQQKKKKQRNEWQKIRMQCLKLVAAACVTIVVFLGSNFMMGDSRYKSSALQAEPPKQAQQVEKNKNDKEIIKREEDFFKKAVGSFQKGFFDFNYAIKSALLGGENKNGK